MPSPAAGLVLFDAGADALSPIRDTRAVFDVRTGALTTRQRLERVLRQRADALFAPDSLSAVVRESAADGVRINQPPASASLMLVNGALVQPPAELAALPLGAWLVDEASGAVVAAHVRHEDALKFTATFKLPAGAANRRPVHAALLTRIWDVIRFRDQALALDLDLLLEERAAHTLRGAPEGAHLLGEHRVAVAPSAKVSPAVVLDASCGPIVLDEEAVIRPGAVIRGPAYVGARSTVLEHALIKENTAIGPACKIAGEVGGTIVQGWSNKAHAGHLGDSWIGSWVNLGADTTCSNLLNTYAEVSAPASPDTPAREPTDLQFLGCIVGDHAKTAIGTRITTGSAIGVGAMIASTAPPPQAVPSFAWLTDKGGRLHAWDRFVEAARAMMRRRSESLTAAQERLLRDLHAQAEARHGAGA